MKSFFLGLEDRLLIVKEENGAYSSESRLHGTQPTHLAIDSVNPMLIYCSTFGHGLWRSMDGGETWTAIGKVTSYHQPDHGKGIRSAHVTFVASQPEKEGTVWAGTEPSAVYYSEDKGESWRECKSVQNLQSKVNWQFPPRPYTSHVRWITPSYSDPATVSVSIEFGALIRSFDGGHTWKDRTFGSPLDAHTLLAHPNQPGTLYAACGDGFMIKGHSYAESHDDGETWDYDSEGLEEHPYLYNMVLHPHDRNEKLVAAAVNPSTGHHASLFSTIYRKQGDQKWEELSVGLECEGAYLAALVSDQNEPGSYYAFNNFGMYRLNAGEHSWSQLPVEWETDFRDRTSEISTHPS